MSRRRTERCPAALVLLVMVLCGACGGGSGRSAEVTVTVSSVVAVRSGVSAVPVPSPAGTTGTEAAPRATRTPSAPAATTPSAPAATTRISARSPNQSSARTFTSIRPAGPISQMAADPKVAGPDDGPACRVDPQYSDEPTTGLRADVAAGWMAAKQHAAAAGISMCLNDGKRSRSQQQALFQQYLREYGSTQVARQYVLPPEKSAHVAGYAIDVQPAKAYGYLQGTAGRLGFCRMYENEPWHFEYSKQYVAQGCPPRRPQPAG